MLPSQVLRFIKSVIPGLMCFLTINMPHIFGINFIFVGCFLIIDNLMFGWYWSIFLQNSSISVCVSILVLITVAKKESKLEAVEVEHIVGQKTSNDVACWK